MTNELISTKSQPKNIGYLTLYEDPSEEFFFEVFFIVDENGYPLDYTFTDKIEVTPVQRVLYGKTLPHYIGIEVCGSKLIDEVKQKPSLILVNAKDLLDLRKNSEIPILFVDDSIISGSVSTPKFISNKDFEEDITATKRFLDTCIKNFDITEPFERIVKALKAEFSSVGY